MDRCMFQNLLGQLDRVSAQCGIVSLREVTTRLPGIESFCACEQAVRLCPTTFTVCSALRRRQESFSDGKKSAVQSYLQHWFSGPQVAAILKKLTFPSDQTDVLQMISPVSQA